MKNTMKKGIMLLVLAVLTAGGVFAQRVGDTVQLGGQTYAVESINGERVTLLKAQGVMTFTSIDAFKTWLDAQPTNTVSNPYNVKINISDLGHTSGGPLGGSPGSLRHAVSTNQKKYVNIDLSGSTFTEIPSGALGNCDPVTSFTISNKVTKIGNAAVGSNSLTSITFQGTIPQSGVESTCFNSVRGGGDLRAKYLAGGAGTYTLNGTTWTKQ
jgi:hypothetical protein